jgi:hypothetical protein
MKRNSVRRCIFIIFTILVTVAVCVIMNNNNFGSKSTNDNIGKQSMKKLYTTTTTTNDSSGPDTDKTLENITPNMIPTLNAKNSMHRTCSEGCADEKNMSIVRERDSQTLPQLFWNNTYYRFFVEGFVERFHLVAITNVLDNEQLLQSQQHQSQRKQQRLQWRQNEDFLSKKQRFTFHSIEILPNRFKTLSYSRKKVTNDNDLMYKTENDIVWHQRILLRILYEASNENTPESRNLNDKEEDDHDPDTRFNAVIVSFEDICKCFTMYRMYKNCSFADFVGSFAKSFVSFCFIWWM